MQEQEYKLQDGFDVRLEARLKNAALIRAREQLGLTQAEAARRMGFRYAAALSNYENMSSYPSKRMQERICSFYRNNGIFILEEDVFPEELRNIDSNKKIVERTIPKTELISLSGINERLLPNAELDESGIEYHELRTNLELILSKLPEKSQKIVRLKYGIDDGSGCINKIREEYGVEYGKEMTNVDIGDHLGMHAGSIHPILEKVMRVLRKRALLHKSLIDFLK